MADPSPPHPAVQAARTVWQISYDAGKRVADGGTDRAATMAYYAVLSLFPGLFVLVVIILRLTDEATITSQLDRATQSGLDPGLADALHSAITGAIQRASQAATLAALFAAALALQSASGWLAATGRAIEPDPQRRKSRNVITGRIRSILWTTLLIVLIVALLALIAGAGPIAHALFGGLGVSAHVPTLWDLVRIPLLLAASIGAMLLVYRIAPDLKRPAPFRALLPGALVAGIGWIIASLAFAFYVSRLAAIGTTYGAFATPVVLLIWLWITGVVVLYGAAVNVELATRRGEWRVPGVTELAD